AGSAASGGRDPAHRYAATKSFDIGGGEFSPWPILLPPRHSITSSARASSVGGTSRPSALAVFRLITNSNLVGAWTGSSAGFAPLKILSTKNAAPRNIRALLRP